MVLFIVFGGYYVSAENVPVCFKWINRCSLIKWAFQGLCINEFEGLRFETKRPTDQADGGQVLERLAFDAADEGNNGAGKRGVASTAAELANVMGFCHLMTLYLLEKGSPRFQGIEDVAPSTRSGRDR